MAGVYPLAVIVFIAAGILAGIEFWRYKKGVWWIVEPLQITLKAARVNAGLTQEEVAVKLRKNKQTIVNWETGKTTIDFANLVALCRLYKVSEDNIFLPRESTLSWLGESSQTQAAGGPDGLNQGYGNLKGE